MKANTLTVTEVVRHFADYVNRVAYRHEAFILRKGAKPIAELRPVPSGRRLGDLPEILRSLPKLSKRDTDTMARDIETAGKALNKHALRDPWES